MGEDRSQRIYHPSHYWNWIKKQRAHSSAYLRVTYKSYRKKLQACLKPHKDLLHYCSRLILIYGIYGLLISIALAGFSIPIRPLMVVSLAVLAYGIKVELPDIIRSMK